MGRRKKQETSLRDHIRLARVLKRAHDGITDLVATMTRTGVPKAEIDMICKADDAITDERLKLEGRMFRQYRDLDDRWQGLYFGSLENVDRLEELLDDEHDDYN